MKDSAAGIVSYVSDLHASSALWALRWLRHYTFQPLFDKDGARNIARSATLRERQLGDLALNLQHVARHDLFIIAQIGDVQAATLNGALQRTCRQSSSSTAAMAQKPPRALAERASALPPKAAAPVMTR
jgi:hypothetical protein